MLEICKPAIYGRQADNFKRYAWAFDFCCLHVIEVEDKVRDAAVFPRFFEWNTDRYIYGSFWWNSIEFLLSSMVVFMYVLLHLHF